MSIENRIKSLQAKHAEAENKILQEESRPLPDSLILKGLRLNKAFLKEEIVALGGETPGMTKEAELVAQKQLEEASGEDVSDDVDQEPSASSSLPINLRHHDFSVPGNEISSCMGRLPEKVAAA